MHPRELRAILPFPPTTDAPATMTLLVDRDGNPLTYL